jgi:hypothetical protein
MTSEIKTAIPSTLTLKGMKMRMIHRRQVRAAKNTNKRRRSYKIGEEKSEILPMNQMTIEEEANKETTIKTLTTTPQIKEAKEETKEIMTVKVTIKNIAREVNREKTTTQNLIETTTRHSSYERQ